MPYNDRRSSRQPQGPPRAQRSGQDSKQLSGLSITKISSPYYFVPLSDEVYWPDWGSQVSHDIPFSDGLSGEIEIEIEAHRPIYIRNYAENPGDLKRFHGSANPHPDQAALEQFKAWSSFATLGDKFAIPSTSIKGMIRNVLKIAAFGSFRETVSVNPEDDNRYSVRDLYLPAYQKRFVSGGVFNKQNKSTTPIIFLSEGGWLFRRNGSWTVYPSSYQRVEQSALAAYTGCSWDDFLNTASADKSSDPKVSAICAKYKLWLSRRPTLEVSFTPGAVENQNGNQRHLTSGKDNTKLPLTYGLAGNLGQGTENGHLVFTGQPSSKRPPKNKHMEFIFEVPSICTAESDGIQLTKTQIRDFEFAHAESKGWQYWSNVDEDVPVPVFWLPGKTPNGLQALGLAQMFRYPAERTLRDGIPSTHLEANHDLADLIFGSLLGKSLRGRAIFSHFVCKEAPRPLPLVWTVLGSPKPTFYPNYLEQQYEPTTGKLKDGKVYATLMSETIQLRGWKRYAIWPDADKHDESAIPAHQNFTNKQPPSFNTVTAFSPLPSGTKFVGRLRFHNLRPLELGALVWTIEMGGDQNSRHSLGMAKGLGLGSVLLTVHNRSEWKAETADQTRTFTMNDLTQLFTAEMESKLNARIGCPWAESDQIKELLLLAKPSSLPRADLYYPQLEVGGRNDFTKAKHKDNRFVLRTYGEATGARNRSKPWNPEVIPRKSGTPPRVQIPPAAEVKVEIVLSRGKHRAKEQSPGKLPTLIDNLNAHATDAIPGSFWRAYLSGTPGNPSYTLVARIDTDSPPSTPPPNQ